eukprot:365522-Chlamydomonas_euryale.AAC.18
MQGFQCRVPAPQQTLRSRRLRAAGAESAAAEAAELTAAAAAAAATAAASAPAAAASAHAVERRSCDRGHLAQQQSRSTEDARHQPRDLPRGRGVARRPECGAATVESPGPTSRGQLFPKRSLQRGHPGPHGLG